MIVPETLIINQSKWPYPVRCVKCCKVFPDGAKAYGIVVDRNNTMLACLSCRDEAAASPFWNSTPKAHVRCVPRETLCLLCHKIIVPGQAASHGSVEQVSKFGKATLSDWFHYACAVDDPTFSEVVRRK